MQQAAIDLKTELLMKLAPISEMIHLFLKENTLLSADNSLKLQNLLREKFEMDSEQILSIRALLRQGIAGKILCDREAGGVRFSRLEKSVDAGLSIDLVHMNSKGPGHTHPKGEIDLSFCISGKATFDQQSEGFLVYPENSWHEPTVSGGEMDIIYFLPQGAMRFEKNPNNS